MSAPYDSLYHFDTPIAKDFFYAFAGDFLGRGAAREVFVCRHDNSMVVKFELSTRDFQNQSEYDIWQSAPDWARKWLAPVRYISPYGNILIQDRAEPWRGTPPKKVPEFLADLKSDNWGLINGKPVAFDYGRHMLLDLGFKSRRMRATKDKWRA